MPNPAHSPLAPFEGIRCASVNRMGLPAGGRSRETDKSRDASASPGIDTASAYRRTVRSKEESGVDAFTSGNRCRPSDTGKRVTLQGGGVGIWEGLRRRTKGGTP